MNRPIITIPAGFLREISMTWDIDWRGQSSGEATDGSSPIVYNAFPRWIGGPEISLVGSAIAQWRAIRSQAQGRVGIYRVPMCDPVGYSDPALGTDVPFSNDQFFSNDQGFAHEPFCTATSGAAAGATVLRLTCTPAPNVGQIMSHDNWPFIVTYADEVSTGVYDCGIQMPLRKAITSGDEILKQGVGYFEATDDGMGMASYGASRVTRVNLSFREVLNR